jgi:putative hydrolase of the HAD superfamily
MPFTTIFFDLDETLYPSSTGLWALIRDRITSYMRDRMGLPLDEIPTLRERYFRQYGTTLRGLQANHKVDMSEYLAYVHDVPLSDYLKPALILREILENIAIQKIIFTNADAAHAGRVVSALELDGCFESVIDVYALIPYCKPMPEAFEMAMKHVGESEPRNCILIDDIPGTVRAAREFGFTSILVDEKEAHPDGGMALTRLTDLPKLASVWENVKK